MRSFLRGLSARVLHGKRRKRPNRLARSLVFERLGARQLLAADGAASSLQLEDEVALADVVQAAAAPISAPESPLWVDQSSTQSLILQDDGYGGYGDVPPEIQNFSGTNGSGLSWTFTGTVIDDLSVEGLTVTFGGLLEGHTTTVRADGTFEHIAEIPFGTSGFVTATVTDANALTSETVYFYVD